MSAVAESPPRRYTVEEFAALPESSGYELVDGYPVEVPMGTRSAWVGGRLFRLLAAAIEDTNMGWVLPQDTMVAIWPRRPRNGRKPDGFVVARGRFPGDRVPSGVTDVPPDLVFEVVSPGDEVSGLRQKVREYLAGGVPIVWVIDPEVREAFIYHRDHLAPVIIEEDGLLDAGDIFPGVAIRLGDVLPPADWAAGETNPDV